MRIARFKKTILAPKSGKITIIDNNPINSLCRALGSPEATNAGAYLHKHIGPVKKGEKLITLYAKSESRLKAGLKYYKENNPYVIK